MVRRVFPWGSVGEGVCHLIPMAHLDQADKDGRHVIISAAQGGSDV